MEFLNGKVESRNPLKIRASLGRRSGRSAPELALSQSLKDQGKSRTLGVLSVRLSLRRNPLKIRASLGLGIPCRKALLDAQSQSLKDQGKSRTGAGAKLAAERACRNP